MFKFKMIVLFIVAAILVGCGGLVSRTGSDNVVTQEEAITGFDRLEVNQGFQVDVSQGDTFSVVIRVDEDLLEHLQVVKDGSTLKIGLEPARSYNLENVTLEADVTMPELAGADLVGGSHLNGEVEIGDVTFNLSGGSHVTLSGSAGDLMIDADGGSHANLGDLAVVDASVDARGGSHATVNPSGRLDAVARGGSHVTYLGSPTLGTIDTDGSSSFKQE
jgi:hypothetical protein